MNKLSIFLSVLAFAAAVAIGGCVKKSFDNPPDTSSYDPYLPVNMSIMGLRNMRPYTGGSALDTMLITQDYTIAAVVNADDRSGNVYKSLYIQDSTGGIQLYMDAYSLYNNYPVGRKIYVKLQGMYLSYNSSTGTPCLSMGISEQAGPIGLSGSAIAEHIIKATTGNVVKDTVISFAAARTYTAFADASLLCRLVTIQDSVQFADTVRAYASPTDATNRYITLCGSNQYTGNTAPTGTMAVRTSNYADFFNVKLPQGRGTITGIYTIFRTTPQLLVRDTNDVKFYGPACGRVSAPPPPSAPIVSVDSIRKLFSGTGIKLGSYRVTGVVITDAPNKNVSTGNYIIQNGLKGVNIYVGGSGTIPNLGDSVIVDVSGDSLKYYAGMMEIDGGTSTKVTIVSSGKTAITRTVTIADLNANFSNFEATLVKVLNATVTGGGTYSGNKTLTDGTGTITLRTATTATFANTSVPTTAKSFTGVAGWFNTTKQILMRNPSDVQ